MYINIHEVTIVYNFSCITLYAYIILCSDRTVESFTVCESASSSVIHKLRYKMLANETPFSKINNVNESGILGISPV